MKFKLLLAVDKSRQFYISQFADALRKKGITCKIIDDLDIYGNSKLNRRYFRWLSKPQELENVINEFKPNIVFTERVSHFSSLILKYNIPLIIFLRGDYWNEVKWGKETLDKSITKEFEIFTKQKIADKCFKESSLILPICKYLEKIVCKNCPDKDVNVLYQGINESDWFSQKGLELKHPCVGLLQGAEIWEKTKEMLILPKIIEKMPHVNFYWAGDGPYSAKILPTLEKFDNFHWLGNLEYPNKVRDFLTEIDIYALVSGLDMSPLTLQEAQLMKKPVIATNVGGIPELMKNNKTGFLVKKGQGDDLHEKIEKLINDKDLQINFGKTGREFIENNFTWDIIADNFLKNIKTKIN